MGKSDDTPEAPNYTPDQRRLDESAKFNRHVVEKQLAYQDDFYERMKSQVDDDRQISDAVVGSQLETMGYNRDLAQSYHERFASVFQPLEDSLIQDYHDWQGSGPGSKRDAYMGLAAEDVGQRLDAERKSALSRLEDMGINPNSGMIAGTSLAYAAETAAQKAKAANEASRYVDDRADAYRTQALALGEKYPGLGMAADKLGLDAGNAAASNTRLATAAEADALGAPAVYANAGAPYSGLEQSGYKGSADVKTAGYNAQMKQHEADEAQSSGWGTAAGLALGTVGAIYGGPAGASAGYSAGSNLPWLAQDGGEVPDQVSPTQGRAIDDVPALLTSGEYIIPKHVVEEYGTKYFDRMLEKSAEGKNRPRRQALEM